MAPLITSHIHYFIMVREGVKSMGGGEITEKIQASALMYFMFSESALKNYK